MNFKDLFNKRTNCCFAVVFLLCLFMSNQVSAQKVTLEGTVNDATGMSLPGVNVQEKGTKNGTSTDFDGKYKLKLSNSKAVVTFSFIGFKTKEVAVAGKTKIDVALVEDSNNLNEVVVVGYGTQQKRDVTGAVASVSSKDIEKIPVSGLDQALQGQVAGLQISSTSGAPGGNTNILVEGHGGLLKY